MRLTIVGCSGSVPGPASPASCYLLQADDAHGRTWNLALDMGSGSLGALQKYCDPRDLDAVAISHLHPDHCADLAGLHVYLKHHPDGPVEIPVFGPFGTASRIEQLRGSDERSDVLEPAVWQTKNVLSVGPMRITVESVNHPVPAYAMRIEGPSELEARASAVLAYSGDTDLCDGLERIARDADVLLCEASFLESSNPPGGMHLTGADAGRVASVADVGRLVVTHVPPWIDPNAVYAEVVSTFSGKAELARPGQHIDL